MAINSIFSPCSSEEAPFGEDVAAKAPIDGAWAPCLLLLILSASTTLLKQNFKSFMGFVLIQHKQNFMKTSFYAALLHQLH